MLDRIYVFNDDHIASFAVLKNSLESPPVLEPPLRGLRYTLENDALDTQNGFALLQTHEDNVRYATVSWSCARSYAKRNLSTAESEGPAILWAVQHSVSICRERG